MCTICFWSALTTAANITLQLGSIKSTVNPTPPEAAATIQHWYRRHYQDPANYYKDMCIIFQALPKTSASRRHQGLRDRLDQIERELDRDPNLDDKVTSIVTKHEDDIHTQLYRKDRVLFDVNQLYHNDFDVKVIVNAFRHPPVIVSGFIRRDQIDTG